MTEPLFVSAVIAHLLDSGTFAGGCSRRNQLASCMSCKPFTAANVQLFLRHTIRRDYLDIEDIYLVRSIEQLKSQVEQRKILSETIREFGKWYEVIPGLERLHVLSVASHLGFAQKVGS